MRSYKDCLVKLLRSESTWANSTIEYLESTAGTTLAASSHMSHTMTDRMLEDQPSVYHKVQGDSVAKRSSGAWGVKGTYSSLLNNGDGERLTRRRQHVAPHAIGPRLLPAAQEATRERRSEQACAVGARIPDICFSGITRALREFSGAS